MSAGRSIQTSNKIVSKKEGGSLTSPSTSRKRRCSSPTLPSTPRRRNCSSTPDASELGSSNSPPPPPRPFANSSIGENKSAADVLGEINSGHSILFGKPAEAPKLCDSKNSSSGFSPSSFLLTSPMPAAGISEGEEDDELEEDMPSMLNPVRLQMRCTRRHIPPRFSDGYVNRDFFAPIRREDS